MQQNSRHFVGIINKQFKKFLFRYTIPFSIPFTQVRISVGCQGLNWSRDLHGPWPQVSHALQNRNLIYIYIYPFVCIVYLQVEWISYYGGIIILQKRKCAIFNLRFIINYQRSPMGIPCELNSRQVVNCYIHLRPAYPHTGTKRFVTLPAR